MDVSFIRGEEISRDPRSIPADLYNKIHLLFARAHGEHLFVPIRSMQYLAIIDNEEIIFVDGQGPRNIEFAWQSFRPQERDDLRGPVSYQCVIYEARAEQTMQRLPGEFFAALELLEKRQPVPPGQSTVTPLNRDRK
jgi:hypothetical protein